jgi:hypothetical protein
MSRKRSPKIERLVGVCKEYDYGYRIDGHEPQIVLVGEKHCIDCLDAQEKIIEVVSPKVVLHEVADPKLSFDKETERILEWQEKYGVPVELCDIPSKNESNPRHSQGMLKWNIRMILRDFGLSEDDERVYLEMTSPLRERYMSKRILSHVDQHNTPLVAVVGAGHVMPYSKIHPLLSYRKIDYMTIVQEPKALDTLRVWSSFFRTH